MPAADPDDQRAARDFEQSLRYDVFSGRAPQAKLDWFLALPKRIRRSRRLIDKALGPFEATAVRAREELARKRAEEFQSALRLAALRQRPRDLSCLQGVGAPWAGIGRRKKRCRAFCAVGRAYVLRRTLASPSAAPVFTLDFDPSDPPRPVTPPGLREATYDLGLAVYSEAGPATSDMRTPAEPHSPPSPPPPCTQLAPGELTVFGHDIDPYFAFIVATGRHAVVPGQEYSLREAAVDIWAADEAAPGALGQLADLLFPYGIEEYDQGLEPLSALVDLCRGWFELLS